MKVTYKTEINNAREGVRFVSCGHTMILETNVPYYHGVGYHRNKQFFRGAKDNVGCDGYCFECEDKGQREMAPIYVMGDSRESIIDML